MTNIVIEYNVKTKKEKIFERKLTKLELEENNKTIKNEEINKLRMDFKEERARLEEEEFNKWKKSKEVKK